ncbi:MAG: AmmeMemoRadiSam system protein A [Geobacter sp.]|nr:MAG: AmmeMemoRadiSam system protein A [Geobacter sp.]
MEIDFSSEERKLLLEIARDAIVSHLQNTPVPMRDVSNPLLQDNRGCFVCIKIDGKLRGCIGNFTSDKPLYQLIQEMAVSAATKDPRFYPMRKIDLGNFKLEISVLSPLQKISSIEEIEIGVHGLYIEKNFTRGVLLPQVAVECSWDRETFLGQTSIKAGMRPDDWKEGADLYIFSADVFHDT